MKIVIGVLIIGFLAYYTTYKSPLGADDVFYEESFKEQEINVVQPDRYNVEVMEDTTDIKFKGDRLDMEELKSLDPYLYVQPKKKDDKQDENEDNVEEDNDEEDKDEGRFEEEQDLIVNVRGMEKYAYDIEKSTVRAKVEEAEKQKVDAKVVLRGEPKKDVVGVEVQDDVIAQFNDDIAENIKEAKIIIDVEGLEGEDEFTGEVVIVDKNDKDINKDILETEEADVKVVTKN